MTTDYYNSNSATFKVLTPTTAVLDKYFDIALDVFYKVGAEQIWKNMGRFSRDVRFYVFEKDNKFISSIFLNPMEICHITVGGIGGVATREEHREKSYAKVLIEKIINDTKNIYPFLLLWTRVPSYFAQFGFEGVVEYFEDDISGSTPMMYFHKSKKNVVLHFTKKLPRIYF